MNDHLINVINQLKSEGKDYTNFQVLLEAIKSFKLDISKDEILEFVVNDYRIQLHSTPNNVAKLISHLAQINKSQSAIDICCGTGNILYYLQNEIDDLTGVEIVDNVAALTKFFISDLHIITADSFQYPFTRKYDLVLGNIPFGMRIEMNGRHLPCEEAFLRKGIELLTEKGRVIMIVPHSVLISQLFYNFRKEFASCIEEIITLPSGIIRNVQIKTAIIVIGKVEGMGVKVTRLNEFENLVKEYKKANSLTISNEKLQDNWDPEYHVTQEFRFDKDLKSFQTKELKDLAEIIKGKVITSNELNEKGDFLYLKPTHIQKDKLVVESALKFVLKEDISPNDFKYIIQPGDIIVSTIFNDLKIYIYQAGDIPAIASSNLVIIRSSNQDYILSFLQTNKGKHIFKTQGEDLKRGTTIPYLKIKDLAQIKIPILPISNLNSVGDRSIRLATKKELQNQIAVLREYRIKPQIHFYPSNSVNEPSASYGHNYSSDFEIFTRFFANQLNKIEEQLQLVNKKLDTLIGLFHELKTEFIQIQNLPREEEEKLFKLYQRIDSKLDKLYKKENQTIQNYVEEVKRWLDLWESLDPQSQKFLPIAELIYDELSRLQDADYAPFVVQYCRTLENEILKKLFEVYHNNGLPGINKDDLIKYDLDNQKTSKFAQMVKRNKVTYTLGDMNFIMALLKQGGNTLIESPLLQHFRAFTISYFDEKIVEAEFLEDVNKLTNDFRNKAAHPYSISINLAKECQILLRKSLNVFLESVKTNTNG